MVALRTTDENRWKAEGAVENALSGRTSPDVPGNLDLALRALARLDIAEDGGARLASAAGRVLQYGVHDRSDAAELAVRMAGDIGFQRDAAARLSSGAPEMDDVMTRSETEAEASGRYHLLPPSRQRTIAGALSAGYAVSARDKQIISDAVRNEQAERPSPVPMEQTRPAPDERLHALEQAVVRAREQLDIGPREWRETGQRATVSMLLHVQVPAMLRMVGADPVIDPRNEHAVSQERDMLARVGTDTSDGPGVNLRRTAEMIGWLGPRLSADVRSLAGQDTPLHSLIAEVDRAHAQGVATGMDRAIQPPRGAIQAAHAQAMGNAR